MPFNPPNLLKGSLVTTQTNRTITFMFNPTSFGRSHSYTYNNTPVGGRSHPLKTGGSGGDENYSFELWLDGDRGRLERKDNDRLRRQVQQEFQSPLSIESDLNDLRSLTRPYSVEGDGHGTPETVICRFGTLVRGDECVINSVEENVVHLTKNLEPQRAVVTINLSVLQRFNQTATEFHVNYPTRSFATIEAGQVLSDLLTPFEVTNLAIQGARL